MSDRRDAERYRWLRMQIPPWELNRAYSLDINGEAIDEICDSATQRDYCESCGYTDSHDPNCPRPREKVCKELCRECRGSGICINNNPYYLKAIEEQSK